MKTITTTIQVTPANLRVPHGKNFGFLRTPKGDAFVRPFLLKQIGRNMQWGVESHAEIERGPKGLEVTMIHANPVNLRVLEDSERAAVYAAAEKGLLFDSNTPGIRDLLTGLRRDEYLRVVEINDAAERRNKWAGLSAEEAEKRVMAQADEAYANDDGQADLAEIQIALTRRAVEAGAPLAGLLARLEAEWAATKARWNAEAAARKAADDARFAACLPLAKKLAETPEAIEWGQTDRRYEITAEEIARRANAPTQEAVEAAFREIAALRERQMREDNACDPYERHVGYGLCGMDGD